MDLNPGVDLSRIFSGAQAGNVNVPTAAAQLFAGDPRCAVLIFANNGVQPVTLWPGAAPPAGGGIPLPVGGVLRFSLGLDGPLTAVRWFGEAPAATQISVIRIFTIAKPVV